MPFVLFLLGAAAVALVASQAKASPKGGGGGRTYKLDKNLPPQLRDQVLAALATQKDPATLLAFGAALAPTYPLAAAALTQRAGELGGAPPLPQPQPTPQPVPQPTPTPTPGPTPNPLNLLAQLPDPPRTQVVAMLTQSNDPNALEAYASQMDAQGYPIAAQALRMKAQILRAQGVNPPPTPGPTPGPGPLPSPGVLPQPGPSPQPTPQPLPLPTPSPFSLDPGMPPQMQSAVLGALTTEQDPVKLAAFAQEIQAQYPIAAGLLMAKANMLRLQPGPGPIPPFPTPPQPGPHPTPVGPPGPGPMPGTLPIGDDTTRSGRNAGRPSGYPFIHLHGESTYPAKISKQATGNEMNYPKMSAMNPQFAADGVHWKNIQTGDALNIPWEWVAKLTPLYRIEVDPGVQPPMPILASPPSAALALHSPQTSLPVRKGPTNGAAASHA